MGATPKLNPYGGCSTCNWPDGETPYNVQVTFHDVIAPDVPAGWPLMNGTFTLHATGICDWQFRTGSHFVQYHLVGITFLTALIWIEEFSTWVQYFMETVALRCKYDFDNTLPDCDYLYHGGTAHINIGLPSPPPKLVPSLGLLPDRVGWKYELLQAADDLEQLYIGSRKYKSNCRVLFNPDDV